MSTHETWDEQTVTVRDALAKMKNEEGSIRGDELQTLKDVATKSMLSDDSDFSETERVMSNFGSGVPAEKVKKSFDLSTRYTNSRFDTEKFLEQADDDEINYYQKEAIKGNLENDNEHMDPERVRIGTIHSAKGKEAETVILGLDSTSTILENMEEDTKDQPGKRVSDAERRVYYVGMTRASDTLVLSEGTIDPSNTIKIGHLLPEYSSDTVESQAQLGSTRSW
jgi:Superfamily I DNA and RNA helicases